MALTATSIAAALGANDLVLKATAATGATVGGIAKVDNEYMQITDIAGTSISVRRGLNGSAQVVHNILAPLVFGLWSDLAALGVTEIVPTPTMKFDVVTIGADTATLTAPVRDTLYIVTKATALATTTLPDPKATSDGLSVVFTSATAAAHVVTLVNGNDGTTGNHTTLTFAAFAGAGCGLVAVKGKWNVVSNIAVTIT